MVGIVLFEARFLQDSVATIPARPIYHSQEDGVWTGFECLAQQHRTTLSMSRRPHPLSAIYRVTSHEFRTSLFGLPQLRRNLLTEQDGVADVALGFGTFGSAFPKGDGPNPQLVSEDFGMGADRALAAASHSVQEGAFGGDALKCVVVVEALADGFDPFVVLTDLDTDCRLAHAR
jgi:hypothetical protein